MSISAGISALIATTAGIYEGTLFIDNMIDFMNEKPTLVPSLPPADKAARHCGHRIELRGVRSAIPAPRGMCLRRSTSLSSREKTVVLRSV